MDHDNFLKSDHPDVSRVSGPSGGTFGSMPICRGLAPGRLALKPKLGIFQTALVGRIRPVSTDGNAGFPEADGEGAHIALGLPLGHGERASIIEVAALERPQDVDGGAPGKAVEQDRAVAEAHGKARGAVLMGRAAAFALGAAPDTAKVFDDLLRPNLRIHRKVRHRGSPVVVKNFSHWCLRGNMKPKASPHPPLNRRREPNGYVLSSNSGR